jgi:hypothetical protein
MNPPPLDQFVLFCFGGVSEVVSSASHCSTRVRHGCLSLAPLVVRPITTCSPTRARTARTRTSRMLVARATRLSSDHHLLTHTCEDCTHASRMMQATARILLTLPGALRACQHIFSVSSHTQPSIRSNADLRVCSFAWLHGSCHMLGCMVVATCLVAW